MSELSEQRRWLIDCAEKVDALGRECADSVTVVTTGRRGDHLRRNGSRSGRRRRRPLSGPRLLGCSLIDGVIALYLVVDRHASQPAPAELVGWI